MSVEQNALVETRPLPIELTPTEPLFPAGTIGEMSLFRVRAADVALVTSITAEDETPVTEAVRVLEDFETFVSHATIDLPSTEGLSKTEKTAVVVSALVHDMRDQVRTEATEILIEQKEAAENHAEELREMLDTDMAEILEQNRALENEVILLNKLIATEKAKYTRLQSRHHDQALIAANRKLEGSRRFIRAARARGAIVIRATILTFKIK